MHPAFRRLTAVTGAILAGSAAALIFASPASAHQTSVKGESVCDPVTGEWVVTWTLGNSETDLEGTLTSVALLPTGTTVTNISVGAVLPKQGAGDLTGVQRVPGSATGASLRITAHWNRGKGVDDDAGGKIMFTGTCDRKAPAPKATFASACDNIVTVTLDNTAGTAPANFTVTGKNGWTEKKTVEAGKTDTVKVPAANSQTVAVTEGANNTPVASNERALPANCGGLPVTGAKVGAATVGALGLLGAGAALFVVARRRRIRFTT